MYLVTSRFFYFSATSFLHFYDNKLSGKQHFSFEKEKRKMSNKNPHIIFNPASAGGKTAKKKEEILSLLKLFWNANYTFEVVDDPVLAEFKVRQAIMGGTELIIAVGGDGTIQHIVNGFFKNGEIMNSNCCLGIINSGTGQGLAQSLGLPDSIVQQMEIINSGSTRKIDLGKITINGKKLVKYFVNELQLGIGASVVKNVSSKLKRNGGKYAFALGTLRTILNSKPSRIKITLNDSVRINDKLTGVVISNGAYTGGGMQLTPHAKLNDGYLDVLIMSDMSVLNKIIEFPKIYSSNHLSSQYFKYIQVEKINIENESDLLEADGELYNGIDLIVEVVPSVLNIFSQLKVN